MLAGEPAIGNIVIMRFKRAFAFMFLIIFSVFNSVQGNFGA